MSRISLFRSPTIKDNPLIDTKSTPDISGKAYLNRPNGLE